MAGRRIPLQSSFASIEAVQQTLAGYGYVAEKSLATAVYLAFTLEMPLFLEGEAGVGKTEVAKVLSACLNKPLLRLQCYEGLDRQSALYEWNYVRQLLHIRVAEAANKALAATPDFAQRLEQELFSEEFLLKRPLLAAIAPTGPVPVLLIDEVDRSDEEFEAFLLELLSDFQVTIPELGTLTARERPLVVLTSNRTRELHDALKRRCLYHWLDFPDFDKEFHILGNLVPELTKQLANEVVAFVQLLREQPLQKRPGVAETISWGKALAALHTVTLNAARVEETLGCLLKYRDDFEFLLQARSPDKSSPLAGMLRQIGVLDG